MNVIPLSNECQFNSFTRLEIMNQTAVLFFGTPGIYTHRYIHTGSQKKLLNSISLIKTLLKIRTG